jgi:tRNA(adenine34) deaminase
LKEGASRLGGWRLDGSTLYVTLEPCPMCAGALVQARVSRLVFGARDMKLGAAGSRYNLVSDEVTNHRLEVMDGILEKDCHDLLRQFFESRR